jgi:hypothetical protein
MSELRRHHGNIFVGRGIVVCAFLMILGANGFILKQAAAPPRPVPGLEVAAVISLIWMFTGAWALCARKNWGRGMILAILYGGTFGLFISAVITVSSADGPLTGQLEPLLIAMPVYLIASLVLTHSRHVRRLTSRAYE